ncbi:MAG: hypothetical protein HY308_08570 [Gammaproteobacteria bacterium]|nr:hypothetical protein [Gammaproteobacteria bacterium]
MRVINRRFLAVVALLIAAPITTQESGDAVVVHGTVHEDTYLAGGTVTIAQQIASIHAARVIDGNVWKSIGLGTALFAATPLVIALLFATLFGVWLALTVLALYLVLLLFGFLIGIFYISELALKAIGKHRVATTGWRIAAVAVAVVALWVITFIPVLGRLVIVALLLLGVGALALYLWRRYAATSRFEKSWAVPTIQVT